MAFLDVLGRSETSLGNESDDGVLYISDMNYHQIRKPHDGIVGTLTGTGEGGFQGGGSVLCLTSQSLPSVAVSLSTIAQKGACWWWRWQVAAAIEFELSR